jgi:hypothetical protein
VIARVIEACVDNRFFVILVGLLVGAIGWWAMASMPVDAIPDLSDVQVIVFTDYPGQAPQVVEDQVTYPLSTAMLSVPYAQVVRGYSLPPAWAGSMNTPSPTSARAPGCSAAPWTPTARVRSRRVSFRSPRNAA